MPDSETHHSREFADHSVTVMGLGRFGGGAGVTRWLLDHGACVTVTDLLSETELANSLRELDDLHTFGRLTLRLGGHDRNDFINADLVVANPAVPRPWDNEFLQAATLAGVPITTEMNLLVPRLNRTRVIGVTGSAGKSTTAAMIHHIITRLGRRSHLGGNIGGSLLNKLHDITPDDWIVLELSSAMLHWLQAGSSSTRSTSGSHTGWSPATAVITNITPNHLDWHGSFEHYEQSKRNITRFQQPREHCIRGDQLPVDAASNIRLRIPGKHNVTNARTAIDAVRCALGIDPNAASLALDDFAGLPHRLQLIADIDGFRFVNDSKSTTPQATLRAVESFHDRRRIHLIAGGYDKGVDLRGISQLANELAGLYTIGATSSAIATNAPENGRVFVCETLDRAVSCAFARMTPRTPGAPGDILLLSPGCASWDQYSNFEHRGSEFIQLVNDAVHCTTATH